MKPRALDLFCGAGGATRGLQDAGFWVLGIDHKPQPRYCGDAFVQADALAPPVRLADFDFVWASPPCQAYIRSGTVNKTHAPRLIEPTAELLKASGTVWVLENVPGAPIRPDIRLCGSQFGLAVRRHRWFEVNFAPPLTAPCNHSEPAAGVYGNPHGSRGAWPGMLPSTMDTWSEAMGIDWMNPHEITQAIPPAYSRFIGEAAMQQLRRAA